MMKLTRKQAIELLTAVVDQEATQEEKSAFLEYVKNDSDLNQQYKSALLIKKLLSERLQRVNAPDHLKKRIKGRLEQEAAGHDQLLDMPMKNQVNEKSAEYRPAIKRYYQLFKPTMRYVAAAAVILFLALTTIEFLDRSYDSDSQPIFIVENYTAQHFVNSGGQLIDPHFATTSTRDAENYLRDHHGIEMTVPELTGAQFAGVVLADFLNGFETPLLEYIQPDINETIYIFAFNIDKITEHKYLKRDDAAVEMCTTDHNFYVAEIDNHHVVSWMWDGNWYSAVSNHNGYDLASLVEPLNYSP